MAEIIPFPRAMGLAEEWQPAPEWEELYEVSNLGRVRSLRHNPPKAIHAFPDSDGYLMVYLYRGSSRRVGRCVHRLVCRAFHGEPNALHREVAHLDGNRADPRAENLKWVSRRENRSHRILHGTHNAGERNPIAKLTEAQAREIKALPHRNMRAVAARFGVKPGTIDSIWRGKNWRHIAPHQRSLDHVAQP